MDIQIVITIPADETGIVWKEISDIFGDLESTSYKTDRDIIISYCKRFDVASLHRDAMLERLRGFRNQRVILKEARHGSIEFVVGIAAVAGFVLWQTLGKDAIESYKSTDVRKQINSFFSTSIDWVAIRFTDKLRRVNSLMRADIDRHNEKISVKLNKQKGAKKIPQYQQFLDDMNDNNDSDD